MSPSSTKEKNPIRTYRYLEEIPGISATRCTTCFLPCVGWVYVVNDQKNFTTTCEPHISGTYFSEESDVIDLRRQGCWWLCSGVGICLRKVCMRISKQSTADQPDKIVNLVAPVTRSCSPKNQTIYCFETYVDWIVQKLAIETYKLWLFQILLSLTIDFPTKPALNTLIWLLSMKTSWEDSEQSPEGSLVWCFECW